MQLRKPRGASAPERASKTISRASNFEIATQSTDEPRPVFFHKYLPRNFPKQLVQFCKPAARLIGRARNVSDLARALSITVVYSLAGSVFLGLCQQLTAGRSTSGASAYGAVEGLCFAVYTISRGEDILVFPDLQRHRLFRLKQKIIPAGVCALQVPAAATVAYLLFSLLGIVSLKAFWTADPVRLLIAGSLCAFSFSIGVAAVRIVFSERLSFSPLRAAPLDIDANALLLAALQSDQDAVLRAAALSEVCSIAETHSRAEARRQNVFADDTGATWQIIAKACIQEVEGLTSVVADSLPQAAPKSSAPHPALQAPKWNQRPAGQKVALMIPDRNQDVAAWYIRSHYQRTAWAIRGLAGFAAASLTEDQFGVLQLTEPGLGAAVRSILSLLLAVQQHLRAAASSGRRRDSFGGSDDTTQYAQALEDVAAVAVRRLADSFGADLAPTVLSAHGTPALGSPAELVGLLGSL